MNSLIDEVFLCEEHDISSKSSLFIILISLARTQATRFCKLCNICICNDCAIENHHEHIAEAKLRLCDVFGLKGKEEWKAFHIKLDTSIKSTNYSKKLFENVSSNNTKTENFVMEINNSVDSIRGKLGSILDSLNDYKNQMHLVTEKYVQLSSSNSCYNQLNQSKIISINFFIL